MTDTTDPLATAIEDAIWKGYQGAEPSDVGLVLANPRSIAVMAAAVARAHQPAVVEPPADRAALRQHIADTIRAAACPGDCGQTEEECARQRIQPGAWHHGVLVEVEGRPELFADAVLAVLPAPADRAAALQREVTRLGRMVDEYGDGASALTAKLKRARDLHRETCPLAQGSVPPTAFKCGMCEVLDAPAAPLRRMADETQPAQPPIDDPDHRHAAALHFLGKPIPADDEDGDRP